MGSRYVFKKKWKRVLASAFDLVGSVVFFWLPAFPTPKSYKRILLIRIDQLGDVIFTTPVIRNLRENFPGAKIDFLSSPEIKELLEAHPAIHEVIPFKNNWFSSDFRGWECVKNYFRIIRLARKKGYDLAIDFRGDLRLMVMMFLCGIPERLGYGRTGGEFLLTKRIPYDSESHQVEANLKLIELIGCRVREKSLEIHTPQSGREPLRQLLEQGGKGRHPRIVIHPGSGYPSKRWDPQRVASLVDKVVTDRIGQVILIGSAEERRLLPPISSEANGAVCNLMGRTNLPELCALLEKCDLFVGNDSGPAHLAAALGKKTLVLFSGTNEPKNWKPWSHRCFLLQNPVFCSPCEQRTCLQVRHYCMDGISVDRVFHKLKEILLQ